MYQTATTDWVDGHTMHFRVADRIRSTPRAAEWRGRRELSLLLTLATCAPLTLCAIEANSPRAVVGGLMLVTVATSLILLRWIKNEFLLEPMKLDTISGLAMTRRATLIPQSHFLGRKRSTPFLSIGSQRNAMKS